MSRILVAEDEPGIARFVTRGLTSAGHLVETVDNGDDALALAIGGSFDLLLLDLGLPGRDGFGVLTELRSRRCQIPVIILTARASSDDVVAGLDGGADDYLTKPFRLAELTARVRLRLRPEHDRETFVLRYGDLSLDLRTRQATTGDGTIDLTAREFALAAFMLRHSGQVLSREQILDHVWGMGYDPGSNVVDVYVRYLRHKLGVGRIETVRGAGYRLASNVGSPARRSS
ncbi:MAG: response regulator transcription factor [Lapillicoccus sp.]